jgi:hypothetical protein
MVQRGLGISTVALGIFPEPVMVPIGNILPSKRLSAGVTILRQRRQIKSLIEEVGLIEPLSVMSADTMSGHQVRL